MKKLFLTSVFIYSLVSNLAMAATGATGTSTHCLPLVIKSINKEVILPGPEEPHTNKIYFFKNLTNQSIWLDHSVLHPSASAGWSSYLRKDHSSALLLNRKNFNLSCALIKPGKVEYLSCTKVLSICVSEGVILKSLRKGTYWLAEDQSWDDLMKAVSKRGIGIK